MNLVKYIIEALVTVACAYSSWCLLFEIKNCNDEDFVFYIFAIVIFIIIGIICVCDIIEDIYYSHK